MLRINAAALKSRGIRVTMKEGDRETRLADDTVIEVFVDSGRYLSEEVVKAIRNELHDPAYQDVVLGMLHEKLSTFQILEAIAETTDR
jgi:hypothetical protein